MGFFLYVEYPYNDPRGAPIISQCIGLSIPCMIYTAIMFNCLPLDISLNVDFRAGPDSLLSSVIHLSTYFRSLSKKNRTLYVAYLSRYTLRLQMFQLPMTELCSGCGLAVDATRIHMCSCQ